MEKLYELIANSFRGPKSWRELAGTAELLAIPFELPDVMEGLEGKVGTFMVIINTIYAA